MAMQPTATPLTRAPIAKTEMLIRRPVADVFAAFVEPHWLTQFWLARASGKLQVGATVRWDFIVHGASTDVEVHALTPNERILISWSGGEQVEFRFDRRGADRTFVTIENSGFSGSADEVVDKALDSTGGFTLVLCELQALLEHDLRLHLGPDKFPDQRLSIDRP